VSSNALSAYTAGSSRQSQLDNIKNNENNQINNNNDNINIDIRKHNNNDDDDINQKRSNDELNTDNKDEEILKKQRIETNEPPSIPSLSDQSKDTNISQVLKEDAIMSAKERYLARKNKAV